VRFTGGEADVVFAFRLPVAPLAAPWLSLGAARPRFVLDIDEDDAGATRQIAALKRLESDDDAARVADADADKLATMADEWIPRVDLVLAAAHSEVGRLRAQYPGITADVLPNPAPPTGDEGPAPDVDLLFVGNCSYTPNIDAARWLCLEVLPILRTQLGRPVRVAVVGSAVDAAVEALAGDPDVVVAADVPSVTPWYRAAKVSVAPLRAGGGTRLKILEAFAHRRPVVSTSLGAEGLPVTDGVHLLIADGADDIATACARLLADHDLRTQLVDAAVKVAIAHARPRIVSDLVYTIAGAGSRLEATHA
jgi:glycosyltransferase involved in cell wall biosynthesis